MSTVAVLAAPLTVAAVLLVVGGAGKLVDPGPAAAAMRASGLGVPAAAVRLAAAGEAVLGLATPVLGGRMLPAATGLVYLGFAAFVHRARVRGVRDCGCLGRRATPPSTAHLVVDLAAAAVGLAAAARGVPGLGALLGPAPDAAAYLMLVAAGTLCGYAALASLPALQAARRALR